MKEPKEQFINIQSDIFRYGEWYCSAGGEHCAEVITTALNESLQHIDQLQEQLRIINKKYSDQCIQLDFLKDENQHMKEVLEENKSLKEQLKDCTTRAKEEIRKQDEENAIRWVNIGG